MGSSLFFRWHRKAASGEAASQVPRFERGSPLSRALHTVLLLAFLIIVDFGVFMRSRCKTPHLHQVQHLRKILYMIR